MLIKVKRWLKVNLSFSSRVSEWERQDTFVFLWWLNVMSWTWPATKHPPTLLLHPPTAGMGERTGKAKAIKICFSRKSLTNEEKNEKGSHYCSPKGSCPASAWAMTALERFPPQFYCWANIWHGITFWITWVSCSSHVFSQPPSCLTPGSLLGNRGKTKSGLGTLQSLLSLS